MIQSLFFSQCGKLLLLDFVSSLFGSVLYSTSGVFHSLTSLFEGITDRLGSIFGDLLNFFSGVLDSFLNGLRSRSGLIFLLVLARNSEKAQAGNDRQKSNLFHITDYY